MSSTTGSGHARWERTGRQRHAAAYAEARAALLGQMVYDRRVALGLTQAELAGRAGMTQPQLSRLESGGAPHPATGQAGRSPGRRAGHRLPPQRFLSAMTASDSGTARRWLAFLSVAMAAVLALVLPLHPRRRSHGRGGNSRPGSPPSLDLALRVQQSCFRW
jgi:hypothetical protein